MVNVRSNRKLLWQSLKITSLQVVPDARDFFTHSSSLRPHTSLSHICPFLLQLTLQEIRLSRICFESISQSLDTAKIYRTTKIKKPDRRATLQPLSKVHRVCLNHKAPNIDSFTVPQCWAGRPNSWTATVLSFIMTAPPLLPSRLCLLMYQQNCFLHVGGPRDFKGALCRSSTGVTSSYMAQLSRTALVYAEETHVGDGV